MGGLLALVAAAGLSAQSQYATSDADGNLISQVTSAAAISPAIVAQPPDHFSQLGASVSFSVVATGSATLAYQWQANHVPISPALNPTAATPTLVLTNLNAGSFTIYRVVVTNGSGSATSNDATLVLDSAGDGIPDSWKIAHFGAGWASNPLAASGADFDGDGISNREEYLDGTDPANASSHFYRLVVTQGQVAVTPAGNRFPLNTVVTLTAASAGGVQFLGWTGDVTSAVNPLVLTMSQNYSVGALSGILPIDRPALPPSFTTSTGGNVVQFAAQSDGKTLVAGSFSAIAGVARDRVARFNVDGSLDAAFAPNVSGAIEAITVQPDGKILIGGSFATVNGVSRPVLARLNSDGSLDGTFDPTLPGGVSNFAHVQIQPVTGKIVASNGFAVLVRYSSAGVTDGTFSVGTGPNASVNGIGFQPDGKLIIAGQFTSINGTAASRIARLLDSGAVESSATFTATATGGVGPILVHTDGKIYACAAASINGLTRSFVRLNATNGSLDAGFNLPATVAISVSRPGGLFRQSNGQVLIAGNISTASGFSNLGRLNDDGTVDGTIMGITSDTNGMASVILDGSGKLLTGGSFTLIGAESHINLARFRASDGLLDSAYVVSASGKSSVTGLKVMPDGSAYAWGPFNVVNGVACNYLARLNPDGSLDATFNSGPSGGPNGEIDAVVTQTDGKVLVGGNFFSYGGNTATYLARLNPDGSLDGSFVIPGAGFNGAVTALTLQNDQRIVVAGDFSQLDSSNARGFARLNANGSADSSFVAPPVSVLTSNSTTQEITLQSNGGFLACGSYVLAGNISRSIIRLNPNGSLDSAFAPTFDGRVRTVLIQPDGKILVGGDFASLNSTTVSARGVARLKGDYTIDPTFSYANPSYVLTSVKKMALQSDGSVIVGGGFQTTGSPAFFRLGRLDSIGRIDRSFRSDAFPNNDVNAVSIEASGAIVIAGKFTAVGTNGRLGYARFVPSTTLTPGIISITPVQPTYPAGATVTLSLSPTSSDAPVVSVSFEFSSDGQNFQGIGPGVSQGNGSWTHVVAGLPPGMSYFRAVVTTSRAIQAHSNAVGPLRSPPVVTSGLTAVGSATVLFNYNGTATNPLTNFTAGGLPAWATATFNPTTGVLLITGTPPLGTFGVTYVTLTPSNAAGSTSATLRIIVGRTYNDWAIDNGLDPFGPATPEGDQSGVGVQNGVRYLLGVGPYDPIASHLPRASVTNVAGGQYLTLTYTRDLTAIDATTVVEIVSGLAPGPIWNSGPAFTIETSRTDNGDGSETVVTRDLLPLTAGGHRFMRLHLSFPPP